MNRFEGKVVLITGASRGIGKAIATRFAAEGAKLALVSNDEPELRETSTQLRARGNDVLSLIVDVSDYKAVNQAVGQATQYYGVIDVLVNNAGVAWEETFLDIAPENWRKMIDINLNGMFYVAQAVAKGMARRQSGVILNMSSTNGLAAEAKYAHYNASKAGVILLTRTMALELGQAHVRVNAVCPGYIVTPMSASIDSPEFVSEYVKTQIPLGRTGTPEDVAGLFAYLASDEASFMTGEAVVVDGGQLAK